MWDGKPRAKSRGTEAKERKWKTSGRWFELALSLFLSLSRSIRKSIHILIGNFDAYEPESIFVKCTRKNTTANTLFWWQRFGLAEAQQNANPMELNPTTITRKQREREREREWSNETTRHNTHRTKPKKRCVYQKLYTLLLNNREHKTDIAL